MAFQDIVTIEQPQFYLEIAFSRANKRANVLRKNVKGTRLVKSRTIESNKLTIIQDVLRAKLDQILKSFPSLDDLTEFYKQLIKATMEFGEIKRSLGAVNWAGMQISSLYKKYNMKILKCEDMSSINKYRTEFYGRVSSVLKQIKSNLKILEDARRKLKDFPSIKSGLKTIAIAGFPNVGKTTLLYKLTGSKPEIASYPFTTKGINVGYMPVGNKKIQLLDTPGTLNRFEKMNNIEKAAYLAIKYAADSVIYVFDLTEPYPLDVQKKLYDKVKRLKPTEKYYSKNDIIDKKILDKHSGIKSVKELKQFLSAKN